MKLTEKTLKDANKVFGKEIGKSMNDGMDVKYISDILNAITEIENLLVSYTKVRDKLVEEFEEIQKLNVLSCKQNEELKELLIKMK